MQISDDMLSFARTWQACKISWFSTMQFTFNIPKLNMPVDLRYELNYTFIYFSWMKSSDLKRFTNKHTHTPKQKNKHFQRQSDCFLYDIDH